MTAKLDFPAAVLQRLRDALGQPPGPVALHEPHFGGNEWAYVKDCLDTGWVSSVGRYVDQFEQDLCALTGARHAIAVVNGTAALHACLLLAGVEPGDEVLMPSLTFVATANATSYCGAVPHFVDVNEVTMGMCPKALMRHLGEVAEMRGEHCISRVSGRRIRAMVPMHTFGNPVELDELLALARQYSIQLVEDAAESLGSLYHGQHTGNMGVVSALSFNGNKVVTTGGGGAVLTNDADLARRAKHMTTTAKLPHRWRFDHDMVGYNYRLPNLNAALGCAQLEALPAAVEKKRRLLDRYTDAFAGLAGVRLFHEPAGCHSNYWLHALILDPAQAHQQEAILAETNDAGIMTRPTWTPMHQLTHFADCPRAELPVTESLARRIINIPSSPQLMDAIAA